MSYVLCRYWGDNQNALQPVAFYDDEAAAKDDAERAFQQGRRFRSAYRREYGRLRREGRGQPYGSWHNAFNTAKVKFRETILTVDPTMSDTGYTKYLVRPVIERRAYA